MQYGEQALRDNREGKPSYALEQAALTIIVTTGWVSLLVARDHTMDYNGGVAHAFFYGLCSLPSFDDTRDQQLHGAVVGFGVLMLLLTAGQKEECRRVMEFNRRVRLPVSLKDIGVTVEDVASVAGVMVQDEDLRHYPYRVTEEMLVDAARQLAG